MASMRPDRYFRPAKLTSQSRLNLICAALTVLALILQQYYLGPDTALTAGICLFFIVLALLLQRAVQPLQRERSDPAVARAQPASQKPQQAVRPSHQGQRIVHAVHQLHPLLEALRQHHPWVHLGRQTISPIQRLQQRRIKPPG